MNQRYKALGEWQKNKGNEYLLKRYRSLRNEVIKMLREAEANYWREKFAESKCSRDFWRTVKKLQGKYKSTTIQALKDDEGKIVTQNLEKAELLNNHFAEVGEKLAAKLKNGFNEKDKSYISRVTPICQDINLDAGYMLKQIESLNPHKSMGIDDISPKEMKEAGSSIIEGLGKVINMCFQTQTYPNLWKTAK